MTLVHDELSIDVDRQASMYAALAKFNRLSLMLRLLDTCGPMTRAPDDGMAPCVSNLSEGLGIAQPTVSHHPTALASTTAQPVANL